MRNLLEGGLPGRRLKTDAVNALKIIVGPLRCQSSADRFGRTRFRPQTGKQRLPRFSPEARKANQALIDLIGEFATQKKATPAQIALAWVLAQKPWIVPIPGTTKLHRLEENLGAVDVEFTPDDFREIEIITSRVEVKGARYSEGSQKLVNR